MADDSAETLLSLSRIAPRFGKGASAPPGCANAFAFAGSDRQKKPSMNPRTPLLAILACTALIVGCDKTDPTAPPSGRSPLKTTGVSPEKADYSFTQRAEFSAAMQRQRAEINQDLQALETKIEKSGDALKAEAQPKLNALREQSARLGTELDRIKDATESTWESVKAGSSQAFAEMKEGFTAARQWASEKIAP
jgi:cytochrome c556